MKVWFEFDDFGFCEDFLDDGEIRSWRSQCSCGAVR